MKRACPICGCKDCPNKRECSRKQHQPRSQFVFSCAKCGCAGVQEMCGRAEDLQVRLADRNEDVDVRQQVEQQASQIENEEKNNMALPQPPAQENSKDRSPKLEVKHIGKKGSTIALQGTGRETSSDFGDSLVMDVKLGAKEYAWFVRMDSGNYRKLFKRFGNNISKWKGKVNVVTDTYLSNKYIKVVGD